MNALGMKVVGAALGLGLATVAAAGLPRLPGDLQIPKSDDSPGQVTFRHGSHVDSKNVEGSCVTCHPKLFGILGRSTEPPPKVTHARMENAEKPEACGACHSKKGPAFSLDECGNCHAQ